LAGVRARNRSLISRSPAAPLIFSYSALLGYDASGAKTLMDLVGLSFSKEIFFPARRCSAVEARSGSVRAVGECRPSTAKATSRAGARCSVGSEAGSRRHAAPGHRHRRHDRVTESPASGFRRPLNNL